MAQIDTVKWLTRKKADNTFETITYLGAEQRFVGALRNSPIYNLEEQYLIGVSSYLRRYQTDDGGIMEEQSFYVPNKMTNRPDDDYYKLTTHYFGAGTQSVNYQFNKDNHSLQIRDKEGQSVITFGGKTGSEYTDKETVYCLDPDIFKEDRSTNTLQIFPDTLLNVFQQQLWWVRYGDESQILLYTKTRTKFYSHGEEVIVDTIVPHYGEFVLFNGLDSSVFDDFNDAMFNGGDSTQLTDKEATFDGVDYSILYMTIDETEGKN